MRQADIVIVGAGLAGSIAATMLGRAGHGVVLVDPRPVYRPEFRCEKIDGSQMRVLEKTGLAETVRRAATFDGRNWVARRGRVVEKRAGDQWGIRYEDLVNTVRGEIPANVEFVADRVTGIDNSDDRQTVTLAAGEPVSARLVIVANGLNFGLREKLGIERHVLSPNHSVSIGFDMAPAGGGSFAFPALTFFSTRPSTRLGYITLFPIGSAMRANLFGYCAPDDPWLKRMRETPVEALDEAMPELRRVAGDYVVDGPVHVRSIDLYQSRNHVQPGVVLVGDAFSTSCPAAGTGTLKVFTDVERLCNEHVAAWLATPGMSAEKIGRFYADPVKTACEDFCRAKAFSLRDFSTDTSLGMAAYRWLRFVAQVGRGLLRRFDVPGLARGKGDVLGA